MLCWRCCHEIPETPCVYTNHRVLLHFDWLDRVRCPFSRAAGRTWLQCSGRTGRASGDRRGSIHAASSELGAMARSRLGWISRNPEHSCPSRSDCSFSVVRGGYLVSSSPQFCELFPRKGICGCPDLICKFQGVWLSCSSWPKSGKCRSF